MLIYSWFCGETSRIKPVFQKPVFQKPFIFYDLNKIELCKLNNKPTYEPRHPVLRELMKLPKR